ncbi:hypothetical protein [Bacillus thuringiensis]|uniref:hypothetical protein n=2 Tax=Bacillus thuringiensis TaxID=1428 RepID=UPI0018DB5885|nr:hypothetical protein [Bacillus thuringiensis]
MLKQVKMYMSILTFTNKLTSEQKFKLLAMQVMCNISEEDLEGIFERGLSVDQLFTGVANRYFKNEKAIRS